MSTQSFKVLITTSGIGSRLGEITKYMNKALVRIGTKPVISYIIEQYPATTKFTLTLGYFGKQVRDYLELAYPEREFEFVCVDNFEGEGSSLLYSLFCAKEKLQEPFIYHACDTITTDTIFAPDHNWIAGYRGGGSSAYASLSTLGNRVSEMHFKGYINSDFLHVGLVGIHDYVAFWKKAEEVLQKRSSDSSIGDVDVLKELVHNYEFNILELKSWYDMGNVDSLEVARKAMSDNDFHVLDKLAESIYKVNGSVIKFFHNSEVLANRVKRVGYLNNTVPELSGVKENFYKYDYVKGDLFSRVANRSNFLSLIKWAEAELWKPHPNADNAKFKSDCEDFYVIKTNKRIEEFFKKKSVIDKKDVINGEVIPKIYDLLASIDIDVLCSDMPTSFHGDFILDNIIMTGQSEFKLIDWRQDFAGNLDAGDKYYDLAKLSHNLVVNHELIDNNHFKIEINSDSSINLNIHRLQTLVECEQLYFEHLKKQNINIKKVLLLRSIIWLNMSPLHHHPFDLFLYYFGKYQLSKAINYIND
jgi:thiamine kinase-like enzyme